MSYRIVFKTTGKGELNKDEVVASKLADLNAAQEAMKAAVKQYKRPGFSVTGSFQRGHAVNYVDGASPVLEGTLVMEVETGKTSAKPKTKATPEPAPEPAKPATRKRIVHPDFQDEKDKAEEAAAKQSADEPEEIEDVDSEPAKPKRGRAKKETPTPVEPEPPKPPRPAVQKDMPKPEEEVSKEPVLNWREFQRGKRIFISAFKLAVNPSVVGNAFVATVNDEVVRNGKGGTGFASEKSAMAAAEAKVRLIAETVLAALNADGEEKSDAKKNRTK